MRVRLSSPVFPYLSRLADGLTIMVSAWIAALLWQWSEGEGSIPFFTEPYLLVLPKKSDLSECGSFVDVERKLQFVRCS